ncbi:magnesium transporter CorA family protein [Heyndrickxia ginsengihumi]|uniref:Magnesium transporter n=1 Tax=Heyndrickxia ginsengihumi TaxID=363870 RepID=A0A0A6VD56_9BACI|nr:magnesium transporter CorA family protein [Heyndrickxia ginsengihumi]KHD85516.1 magnesium transporter [Heyndrickxia ginsengihumi]MBE6182884.1 magnesium transporter CorA family protein [Bacillus sp. (in: firmicutes)]MCM3023902.1 magnesium transporter CorA family protein [Heyndrickxia ginsengihumi]NEY19875.1 magnesium transporter CorA family protein [Heyndrickxia ginsengihumi]
MLNMYLTDESGKLKETDVLAKGCWINLVNPTEEEINQIVEATNIPIDFVKDPLDVDERSRIEKEDDDILIIVGIPVKVQEDMESAIYDTIPLGIIITPFYFITVCLQDNPIIGKFIHHRVRGFYSFMKTRFTLQILYEIASYYLNYLKYIDRKTSLIERELHESMRNKELFELLSLEKTLVYFTTSLKANKIVMEKMTRQHFLKIYEDDVDLLEDVMIEVKQAIEMCEVHSNILSGMMDAYASVISNNVNGVMKFLTTCTIILSLPTMVASFFGMNVPIPYQHTAHAFVIPLAIAVVLSVVTAYIFWKKKYF